MDDGIYLDLGGRASAGRHIVRLGFDRRHAEEVVAAHVNTVCHDLAPLLADHDPAAAGAEEEQ